MSRDYYPQSERREPTMTVGQLIAKLQQFDPAEPVIFRSPEHGCFGPNNSYSIDFVARETLEREEQHYPAETYADEEGNEHKEDAWTQVFHAWSGVVIR